MALLLEKFDAAETANPRAVIFMPLGAALYGCIACLLQHLLSSYNGGRW